ncbi:MAG: hypothetical protein ACREHC_00945 [Candidatus Levyibacteriota bacterium]
MSDTIISAKVDLQTKKKAMQVAEELGIPLNVVLKRFIQHFIETKTADFTSEHEEEPSEYGIAMLKKSEEDVKAGRVSPTFTNAKDAIAWLDDPNASYANGNKVRDEI